MSRSHGTGYPHWFLCPFERRRFTADRLRGAPHKKVRTGKTRRAPSPGKGSVRKLQESHEYRCSCGHVGWSCHVDVLRTPLQPTKEDL